MKYPCLTVVLLVNVICAFGQQEAQPLPPGWDALPSPPEKSSQNERNLTRPRTASEETTCTKNNGQPCPEWLHKLVGQYPRKPESLSSLPNAPQPQGPEAAGFWTFRGLDGPVLRTNREAIHDKTLLGAEAFWLGSIVYDAELTHQGLAHHKCVEASTLVDDRHPSRGELYVWDVPEFAVGTALNYLMLRFVGKPLIFETVGIASVEHLRGGSRWLTNCW